MKHNILALGFAASVIALGSVGAIVPTVASQITAETTQPAPGSFLPANQAIAYLKANKDSILIDIRSPEEVNASGMPTDAAKNIPFKLSGNTLNTRFAQDVDNFMQHRKNMSVFSTIILLCKSSTCAGKAVQALDDMGYESVYTVPAEWQRHNLPWTKQIVPEKKYHVSSNQGNSSLVR